MVNETKYKFEASGEKIRMLKANLYESKTVIPLSSLPRVMPDGSGMLGLREVYRFSRGNRFDFEIASPCSSIDSGGTCFLIIDNTGAKQPKTRARRVLQVLRRVGIEVEVD